MAKTETKTETKSSPKRSRRERPARDAEPAKGRGTAKGVESITYVVFTAIVLVLLNVAGQFFFFRVDLTRNKLYSLSQASKRLVSDLEDDMEITGYFTADLPPPHNAIEQAVRNLLAEYEAASNGRLHVRFVNPDDEEEIEAARDAGITEEPVGRIEGNRRTVMQAYRGLVIQYAGERQVIPVIADARGLEYEITQRIRLLVRDPLPVGVLEGHGALSPTSGLSALRSRLQHYELRTVDVSEEIDPALRALLIVNPTEEISEVELRRINQYVMNGGSLGVFGGTVNVELQGGPPRGVAVDTGINRLLEAWGVEIGEGLVADARCAGLPLRPGLPIFTPYPPAPRVIFDREAQEHPVLFRLPQADMWFTSPITVTDRFHELGGTVLARSSEDASWLMTGDSIPLQPRNPTEWRMDGPPGPYTLLVALGGTLPSAFPESAEGEGAQIEAPAQSTDEVRVLISGSGALLRDEFLPPAERQLAGVGPALALNAVDWLAGDADLIAIRAKNIEDPALELIQEMGRSLEEAVAAEASGDEEELRAAIERHNQAFEELERKQEWTKWGISIGMPLLVILFGLIRWRLRKNKRANLEELRKRLTSQRKKSRAA